MLFDIRYSPNKITALASACWNVKSAEKQERRYVLKRIKLLLAFHETLHYLLDSLNLVVGIPWNSLLYLIDSLNLIPLNLSCWSSLLYIFSELLKIVCQSEFNRSQSLFWIKPWPLHDLYMVYMVWYHSECCINFRRFTAQWQYNTPRGVRSVFAKNLSKASARSRTALFYAILKNYLWLDVLQIWSRHDV